MIASSRVPLRLACSSRRASVIARSIGSSVRWNSAYTWLTKTPHNIFPEDVVSSIPSFHETQSNAVPILLVTPSLAHWLDPTSSFVSDFMTKFHQPSQETPSTRHAVAAVVDKIPNVAQSHSSSSESASEEYEGVSLLVIEGDNLKWKAEPPRRIGDPAGEEPSLVVSVRDEGSAHAVGLRLANTVFINGKERTFLGMRFTAGDNGYVLDRCVGLTNCVVTSSEASVQPELSLPLHPVTQRRRVITGMGNILRQLAKSTDPSSAEPMPASTELEKELPRYIEENNIADRRVSVWALVEKPDIEIAGQGSSTQDRLTKSLSQGGKLHRVMSGGGGWGKKQGLLSLDPEVAFPAMLPKDQAVNFDQVFDPSSRLEEPLEMPSFLENGLIGEDLSHLSQVANAGDFIEFYVSVEPSSSHNVEQESKHYCFGVVSNAEEGHQAISSEEKHLKLVANTFGALSEKAITYTQPVLQEAAESTTKLDIPGCRVML
ncbi:hypothetical protein N7493_004738 [Penicillium malachiteum]|uniref:Uncharacterized protein n=1 Tax=Penicillium malachiteum TaxID=1324776 RepID=A0AAD6HPG5_9EURO|nr:hypothetical protein N7493_004738 [Penicillium malachiteum]